MKRGNPVIALAQIKYFSDNTRNNLLKIKKFIHLASKKGADIVCFPESCVHKSALELNHKIIEEIKETCKKEKIWTIITDDFLIKGKTYNTSLLINREGEIVGGYKKIHLYGDKTEAGKKFSVFQTDFAKTGIAICWDLAFPDLFKKMKKAGAQIVFCPAQWWYDAKAYAKRKDIKDPKKREQEILSSLIKTRAFENVYYVALCNPILDSKFQVSYSAIASPSGKILKSLSNKEGIVICEINLKEIKKLEKIYSE
jgi:predicted amidohydrolase